MYKSILLLSFLSFVSLCVYASDDDDAIAFKVVTGSKSYFSTVTFFKNGDVTREVVGGPPTQAELIDLALLFAEEFVMVEKPEQVPSFSEILPEKRRSWSLWETLMEKIRSFSR